jgi:hypothetical protein
VGGEGCLAGGVYRGGGVVVMRILGDACQAARVACAQWARLNVKKIHRYETIEYSLLHHRRAGR